MERMKFRHILRGLGVCGCLVWCLAGGSALFGADGGYTNHAGNVVAGWPVALTAKQVTLREDRLTESYPLSIFPESEQRRMAVDFGEPRLPHDVRTAWAGYEKAVARSRLRAEKGLCTKEQCEEFCAKSAAAFRSYLERQVKSGAITSAEQKLLMGRL